MRLVTRSVLSIVTIIFPLMQPNVGAVLDALYDRERLMFGPPIGCIGVLVQDTGPQYGSADFGSDF
jgi:hypothetical protein